MRILITGHRGLLGSACVRRFQRNAEVLIPSDVDYLDEQQVYRTVQLLRPDTVVHCAARVGGVKANRDNPIAFMRQNLKMQSNVIDASAELGVTKLVFIGTSCMFPRDAAVPVVEESMFTGKLEDSVEAYAIAKLAGWRLCKAYFEERGLKFFTVCPSNIYGPGDNYSDEAHVIPALIRRVWEAKRDGSPLKVWGDGTAVREFIYVDDVASAIEAVLEKWNSPEVVSIGTGVGTSVSDLVSFVTRVAGFNGPVEFDSTQPTGIPRKTFSVKKLHDLGWDASISLPAGLIRTWEDFEKNPSPRGFKK